jgi:hypothetical protein
MVVATPHPEVPVHFSLVENISINIINISIQEEIRYEISWRLNRAE